MGGERGLRRGAAATRLGALCARRRAARRAAWALQWARRTERTMQARWLGIIGVMAALGCGSGTQREYDFTNAEDRAQWQTEGLAYQGSVGPYALFRVTGKQQRLIGPSVALGTEAT